MMNEKLLSILNEPQPNDASILERLIGSLFYAVLNISKAYESNKTKWNDLNAYQKLLDLSKKTNRKKLQETVNFLTIPRFQATIYLLCLKT